MEPSIPAGSEIIADLSAYTAVAPKRWDIVIFEPPEGNGLWTSRVVGLPGETIDFSNDILFIDGKPVVPPENLKIQYTPPLSLSAIRFPYEIPEGAFFILGDNSKNANDSRYWGALPLSKVKGKVVLE